jgi:creatinine amidohydrolase
MMLFIAPATVDMSKAIKDYHPSAKPGLTRDPKGNGCYSASGIYGDATLATRQKGEIMVRAIIGGILKEIQELRGSPLQSSSSSIKAGLSSVKRNDRRRSQ